MKWLAINVGPTDAFLRILLGLLLLVGTKFGLETGWAIVGLILVITGALRRCPAYLLAGINGAQK
jgi:Protein of unknown function (DUF2892)